MLLQVSMCTHDICERSELRAAVLQYTQHTSTFTLLQLLHGYLRCFGEKRIVLGIEFLVQVLERVSRLVESRLCVLCVLLCVVSMCHNATGWERAPNKAEPIHPRSAKEILIPQWIGCRTAGSPREVRLEPLRLLRITLRAQNVLDGRLCQQRAGSLRLPLVVLTIARTHKDTVGCRMQGTCHTVDWWCSHAAGLRAELGALPVLWRSYGRAAGKGPVYVGGRGLERVQSALAAQHSHRESHKAPTAHRRTACR
jgi:hypothetical protein